MSDMRDAIVVLLAGGQGERLWPLTRDRAKPAVPFGALYRIIDITLSNCINSNLRRIFILTQYKALSLNRHIRAGWSPLAGLGDYIEVLPPQMRVSQQWYQGTADAVYQNIYSIGSERSKFCSSNTWIPPPMSPSPLSRFPCRKLPASLASSKSIKTGVSLASKKSPPSPNSLLIAPDIATLRWASTSSTPS